MATLVNNNLLNLFQGKRVLVIGDTGFKGSWLSLWLKELGADVVGYSLPPERKDDHFNQIGLVQLIHHVDGDIRDLSSLQKVAREFNPEIIFHLAAQALVKKSYEEPKLTFDTNVGGSVNVLETVRLIPSLQALIYVTSDKCYSNKEWVWGYRENDELGGKDPYSASKAAAENIFFAYQQSFFKNRSNLGAATVRAGNVIGGGDWSPNRIIPDCIKALRENRPILLRNPLSTRPWQHVLEPVRGYLELAMKLLLSPKDFSGSWNFGPSGESIRTVQNLVNKIIDYWGKGKVEFLKETSPVYEAQLLQLNCDKAHQKLQWKTYWDFDQTIFETVKWYKEVHHGKKPLEISKQQIKEYYGEKND